MGMAPLIVLMVAPVMLIKSLQANAVVATLIQILILMVSLIV